MWGAGWWVISSRESSNLGCEMMNKLVETLPISLHAYIYTYHPEIDLQKIRAAKNKGPKISKTTLIRA
jgi:hypothetical protein